MNRIKVGSDPEFFTLSESGEVMPCVGLIRGTKKHPLEVRDGFMIQEDNVMLEFNIPPASSSDEFIENVESMTHIAKNELRDYGIFGVKRSEVHIFSPEQLVSAQANTYGCSPDFDVYTREDATCFFNRDNRIRYSGGHIHVGYDNPNEEISIEAAKLLDVFLGLPLSAYSNAVSINGEEYSRNMFYGSAGRIRFKDYGFEYRTPSNAWVFNKNIMEFVFNACQDSINLAMDGESFDQHVYEYIKSIIGSNQKDVDIKSLYKEIINTNDRIKNYIEKR